MRYQWWSRRSHPKWKLRRWWAGHLLAAHAHLVDPLSGRPLDVLEQCVAIDVTGDAELKEIDEDIAQNATMARKYGDEFFTEGTARLNQSRVRCRAHRTTPTRTRALGERLRGSPRFATAPEHTSAAV